MCFGELQKRPTIVVFEDVHWADEATLNLIKFLARRIQRTTTLFILTYRDDQLSAEHPLRLVLGDLPRGVTNRFQLYYASDAARGPPARSSKSWSSNQQRDSEAREPPQARQR